MTVCLQSPQFSSAQGRGEGFIGLALQDAPGAGGAKVAVVQPGSPADKAGVKEGDVIVAINGSALDQAATMTRIIKAMSPGQTARLSVVRKSKSSPRRRTIAVVLGSSDGAGGTAANSAAPGPAAKSGAAAHALSVSGYVRLTDPQEHAFTADVPAGWRSEGGLARRSALQINPYLRSLSPDKMTYLMIGEPTLPTFSPPSRMGNAIGHPEGTLYDAGLGGRALVMHYLPGAKFARRYGETALQGLCPSLRFVSARERRDLAHKAEVDWPTVIPSRYDGGEARFTCVHNNQEMEARVEAVTRDTRDNVMWAVILLQAYLTPKGQSKRAEEILEHMAGSVTFSQEWTRKQNNLSQQAAASINRRMQETFRQQQVFMQKFNSVDQSFEAMDELVSGFSTYHDQKTGNDYSLNNTNPFKWIDDQTGRIISTPTNTKPLWGPAFRSLEHAH
jgi:hypothetical protein